MKQEVNCVYRVHTQGEIIPAKFNLLTGQIIGFEDLVTVDMNKNQYRVNEGKDSLEYLIQKIIKWKQAIAVISSSKIGTIIITKEVSFQESDINCFGLGEKYPLLKIYDRKIEIIGAIKTPIYTLKIQTPQELLIVDKTNGEDIVHTRYGRKYIEFKYDKLEDKHIDMSLQVCMCKNPNAFATCKVEGIPRLVFIKGTQLEVYKEETK